ncbi:MAG: Na+ dependent nucleoside transporter domain-containing protein [Bdellovibrionales bacterium GWA2_49_15]|nr:MAG: Na+ dependent nucleoside transporter domain-containing protein [Bdellovibrionales bacterium GWA2_49_15]
MERVISFIGLLVIVGFCFLLSPNKKKIDWRTVVSGILLQIVFGLIILKTTPGRMFFDGAKDVIGAILNYTNAGSNFVFGPLNDAAKLGFIFATMVLPTIIFMSALMSVGYHIGIMQLVIKFVAKVMVKVMGTSGAESLAAAANIFAGQTEAPLVIKPYIALMTRSEMLALMTGGMATVAGGVLAAYVGLGIDAGHLLAASVMSAPAALVCAKLMLPETEHSVTKGKVEITFEKNAANVIDAAAMGASEGLQLAFNVAGMLLAFIALIAMFNGILSWMGGWFNYSGLSLELISGYILAPVAWILGVPWNDCIAVGSLLGKKLILNEFVAYLDLQKQLTTLSPRAVIISTYALCGFANFSSIGIQLGGIGTLAPSRRKDLAELGIKSLIAGTAACLMTAAIAGLMI